MGMKFWEKMQENKHCLGVENGFTIPFIMGAYMGNQREFIMGRPMRNQREFYRNKEQISSFVQRTLRDIYRAIYYSKKTIKIIECPECDNELIIFTRQWAYQVIRFKHFYVLEDLARRVIK